MPSSTYDYGYIREPKEVTELLAYYNALIAAYQNRGEDISKLVDFPTFVQKKLGLVLRKFTIIDPLTADTSTVTRWCKLQKFKPSKDQIVRYLKYKHSTAPTKAIAKQYEVPLTLKTKQSTTARKELERIVEWTGDEVLAKCLEYRSVHKLITNDLKNWTPGPDGRVHSTFRYVPPTGQFNSSQPNVQNCSKHSELGQLFRGIVEAPQGYCFVESDFDRFHLCTMGRLANDPNYIRFGQLDSHTIFTSYVVGCPIEYTKMSDVDIKLAVREVRANPLWERERNERCKHTVLGNQLGMGPRKLWWMNRKFISNIKEAEQLQEMLADLFPLVEKFKREICEKAHQQGYLINSWQVIQWFFDVFSWSFNKRTNGWEKKNGSEHEMAIASLVQGDAFGMVKDKMKQFEISGTNEEHNFCDNIHDSLMFMSEIGKRDKCIEAVYNGMSSPCTRLAGAACPDGLKVGVSIATGRVWRKWDKEKNPDGMREITI